MNAFIDALALDAFHRAAQRVPAYRTLLHDAGINPDNIKNPADFTRLPVLRKQSTFQRFPIEQLCIDGEVGELGSVLTSSGHSGLFAFGLNEKAALPQMAAWIDDLLDELLSVRSLPTLLINCLPMGVRVPTLACTLAETSVRPDMVIGLIQAFKHLYAQIILVGDAAFIKHVLELGGTAGLDWPSLRVQVFVGEEPLAENARKYLEGLLGADSLNPDRGLVASSMGVAELGLNLFFEVPPRAPLIRLRRTLHQNAKLRHALLGPMDWVPSLFTHDPRRILVEFDEGGRMLLTTLDPQVRVPLIRYATGDLGRGLTLPPMLRPLLEDAGIPCDQLDAIPIVAISGRGEHALAGRSPVYPEAVKEGLYHEPALAKLLTANFRLASESERVRIRVQLSPGVLPDRQIEKELSLAIRRYVCAPLEVSCERYETFDGGMSLDYERKFSYLKP